jgi:Cdc6-like AAA superfamily ATPase
MEDLNFNKILNREEKASNIKEILTNFELNKNNLLFKKGIYVYGDPGSGKTTFVTNILKEMNYDIMMRAISEINLLLIILLSITCLIKIL